MTEKSINGVDHIAIQLPSLVEGLYFFNELLGFKVSLNVNYDGYQIIMLKAGKIEIEMWENQTGVKNTNNGSQFGVHHLALQVKDLDIVVDYMKENDVEILMEIYEPTRGIREAIVQGPGGVRVQFVEQNVPLLIWRSIKGDFKEN